MVNKVFINLPVKELGRSMEFFRLMGFGFDMRWADEKAVAVILNENTFVMLLTNEFYRSFTLLPVNDTNQTSEVIVALEAENREQVDEYADKASAAGAQRLNKYEEMEGAMYGIRFADPDGHLWEIFYMDVDPVRE